MPLCFIRLWLSRRNPVWCVLGCGCVFAPLCPFERAGSHSRGVDPDAKLLRHGVLLPKRRHTRLLRRVHTQKSGGILVWSLEEGERY